MFFHEVGAKFENAGKPVQPISAYISVKRSCDESDGGLLVQLEFKEEGCSIRCIERAECVPKWERPAARQDLQRS